MAAGEAGTGDMDKSALIHGERGLLLPKSVCYVTAPALSPTDPNTMSRSQPATKMDHND